MRPPATEIPAIAVPDGRCALPHRFGRARIHRFSWREHPWPGNSGITPKGSYDHDRAPFFIHMTAGAFIAAPSTPSLRTSCHLAAGRDIEPIPPDDWLRLTTNQKSEPAMANAAGKAIIPRENSAETAGFHGPAEKSGWLLDSRPNS